MLNKLYNEFATHYAAITNDRDFKAQSDCILSTYTDVHTCKTFLELFAGQSLHSIEMQKNLGIDVWAIDSSEEMKRLAISNGFKNTDNFIVGDLPGALANIPDNIKFDCIICLFHGLSNLSKDSIYSLFEIAKQKLNSNGRIFIEMHDIRYIMEYISNPIVRYTSAESNNGVKLKYAWPSEKIMWDALSFKASVPVQIIVDNLEDSQIENFISSDYIHSADDVLFISKLLGYKCQILSEQLAWQRNFELSIILELSII